MYKVPVLFNIFNRPIPTQKVFDVLRVIQPAELYVHADGPREGNDHDLELCRACRAIIQEQIDWSCNLYTLFREQNLGCGKGPASAITWFFEHVEQGIILEDDCVPHPDFFYFCEDMLVKYKDNNSITSIAGSNFQDGHSRGSGSYYFSLHNRIWVWATWRRVWKHYDYYMQNADSLKLSQVIKNSFTRKRDIDYWFSTLNNVKSNRMNDTCWDFQFMYLQWCLRGLTVTPNKNLVSNIGNGPDATHTDWGNDPNLNRETETLYPLVYNNTIEVCRLADNYYMDNYILHYKNILQRIWRKFLKILHKIW